MRAARSLLLTAVLVLICSVAFVTNASAGTTEAPVITQGPADGAILNKSSFTLAWTFGGPAPWSWFVLIDGVSQMVPSGTTVTFVDGAHTISIYGLYIDPGNAGTTTGTTTVNFTVDTTAPDLAVTAGPNHGSTVAGNTTSFSFSGEAGLPIYCSADAAPPVDCTNGLNLTALAPGLHSLTASSTDAAGNATSLTRLFLMQAAAGTNKKNVRFCYRTKITKRGKIVRTKAGKVKTRRICKTVSITY
jgi:hypothetical protein